MRVLGKDIIKEWFDDISEVQAWLASLTIYCSEEQRNAIRKISGEINEVVSNFEGTDSKTSYPTVLARSARTAW